MCVLLSLMSHSQARFVSKLSRLVLKGDISQDFDSDFDDSQDSDKIDTLPADFVKDVVDSRNIFDKRLLKLYSLNRSVEGSKVKAS